MENLQNNPIVMLFLAVLLACGIVYAGYAVFFKDMQEQRETLIQQIGQLEKEVEEGRRLEAKLPELQAEIKAKEEELEKLKKILPPVRDTEKLVRQLERLADDANLQILEWSSRPMVDQEFYREWSIGVQLRGTFHNLGQFFAMLSRYARIVNIAGVRMTKISQPISDRTIQASFTAVTYVYKEAQQ